MSLSTKQLEILAIGRRLGPLASRRFSDEQEATIRQEYEDDESSKSAKRLAKKYGVSKDCIYRAVRRAGGIVSRRQHKYFRNPTREKQLNSTFGLSASDMDFLYESQKGLCLWCRALLSKDSLKNVVDHKHSKLKSRRHARSSVRGICCPDGHCNRIAGMIERGIEFGPLFSNFVENVRLVVSTNHGIFEEKQR